MRTLVVSLLVLSFAGIINGVAVDTASQDVSVELMVPRGQTREAYLQSIVDYWTPERMASAQPMNPVYAQETDFVDSGKQRKGDAIERILTRSTLPQGTRAALPSTAGKVYFVLNGQNYLCSGSVVSADNQDLVVTAGHCVFEYERQIWASNWIFVPEYRLGSRPHGSYTWRQMATKRGWMDNRDFNYDVGIVLMNRNDQGRHIQEVTGGLGLTLNPNREAQTNSFGYPMNINSGETMSTCAGIPSSPAVLPGFIGLRLACGMTGGCSGGPWIHDYDTETNLGQQVSVNSFIMSNQRNFMFGPYFNDDNIGSLYTTYKDQ